MKPRINVITLAVDDLQRSLLFYCEGLGLTLDESTTHALPYGRIAHLNLQNEITLALWSSEEVGSDRMPQGLPLFALSHIALRKIEVFIMMAQAERAGADIVQQAANTYWGGYAGYFRDPDSYLWEISWNPEATTPDTSKALANNE